MTERRADGQRGAAAADDLRRRAESRLARGTGRMAELGSTDELAAVVHELRVHEVELAMQNEELRRSQADLSIARDAYRELYEAAPIGYVLLDLRGMIVDANQAAVRLFGIDAARLTTTALPSFMSREDADRMHLHLIEVLDHGDARSCELVIAVPERGPVHVRLDSVVARSWRGAGTRFRTTISDISDRVELERELRALNADLEARVEQRSAEREKLHAQLASSQRMAAIGRLAGGVAHDFNNLLTVLRLESEMLRRQLADRPESRSHVDELARVTDLASALTARLLAFARRDVVRSMALDPAAAIRAIESTLARLAGDHVQLRFELEASAGWIEIDPVGLEQVIINLVVNSRDAVSDGGAIDVHLGHRIVDAVQAASLRDGHPGHFVTLTVRDDGVGMSAETMAHLFEPFFTTKAVGQGSGLGLATVYGTVVQAGGFVDVRSELGGGTEIVVYLPRIAPAPSGVQQVAVDPLQGRGETVLLVDDEPQVRKAVKRLLESSGYRVIAAESGADALDQFMRARASIDLLLSDVVMPGMSGLTLVARVHDLDPRLPVILMSGFMFDEMIAPSVRFLQKPFRLEDALHALRAALDQARRPAADTATR